MWPVVGILVLAILVCAFEVPGLLRKRFYKDLVVFSCLLFAGVALCIAYSQDVKIPNPVDGINYLFMPLSKWLEKL
ncbi:hypothetical protein ACFFNY_20015 [Paenibacillus hodogayensis]|uniref:Uncharacterized protein n=1 Tax=Paenibacillus hodogayensis TaxID=279208 RepID=A0ABV5W0A6_9BACL